MSCAALRPRIFIVDDHLMMREGLRCVLAEQRELDTVGEACDVDTAWEAIDRLQPDLVLMDLDLPGGGGIGLTRRIRCTHTNIKVLVLTGLVEPRFVDESLAAGAGGYLLKTNGGQELLAAIEAVLAGKTYLCVDTTTAMLRANHNFAPGQSGGLAAALSEREKQVLRLVVEGLRNKEIAVELGIGVKSVETYRSRLMKKLDCSSPAELVRAAIRAGLSQV